MTAITIRLVGGLANRMLQYAAGIGLARHGDCRFLLDLSAFANYAAGPYQLDKLRPSPTIRRRSNATACRSRAAPKAVNGVYFEPRFHFDQNFFELGGEHIRLEGYFQSPLYFAGCNQLLRERFQPVAGFGATAQAWADRIDAAPGSVSLQCAAATTSTIQTLPPSMLLSSRATTIDP